MEYSRQHLHDLLADVALLRKRAELACRETENLRKYAIDQTTASRALLRNTSHGLPDLQLARWHVCMGEAHVARQYEIIAKFPDGSKLRANAEELLRQFESILREHKAHLARLEKIKPR
ncbi:MAG: hypothetical protein J2P48_06930 [Alphaproteobacteria bacterium]|nr:hypothetical protein [Alphaproteobacteria bacterium]